MAGGLPAGTVAGVSLGRGGASLTGAELTWRKTGSGRMAGGRAEAAIPVLTVQDRATAGGSIVAGNTDRTSAEWSLGGSALAEWSTKLSRLPGGNTGNPPLMTGTGEGSILMGDILMAPEAESWGSWVRGIERDDSAML